MHQINLDALSFFTDMHEESMPYKRAAESITLSLTWYFNSSINKMRKQLPSFSKLHNCLVPYIYRAMKTETMAENVKTIKFVSVHRTDLSNILSVRPIFQRSGIKSPKIIDNFLSISRTDKFKNLSVRPNICRSRTDGPTVFIFSAMALCYQPITPF